MVVLETGTRQVGPVGQTRSGDAQAASAMGREQVFFHTSNKEGFVSKLLDAHDVGRESFDPLLRVEGRFFVDLSSGAGVMTIALHFLSVPALRPWDVGAGEKWIGFTGGGVLIRLAKDIHSWARCSQVRSLEHIFGLPYQSDKGHNI